MNFIARRNWALRLSIVLNVCVLLYVCAHLTSSGPWIEEAPSNWGGSNVAVPLAETYGSPENVQLNSSQRTKEASSLQSRTKAKKNSSDATEKSERKNDKAPKSEATTTKKSENEKLRTSEKNTNTIRNATTAKMSASQDNKKDSNTVRSNGI